MKNADYDDPIIEEQWCEQQRLRVAEYLKHEEVQHRRIAEWPAFHAAPYVAIWAIESFKFPDRVGWWVISGDLPTDYISAGSINHPREAMRCIAERWMEISSYMKRGVEHPDIKIGFESTRQELGELLEIRAKLLLQCANDDSEWESEDD